MLVMFFNYESVFNQKYTPMGHTIMKECYVWSSLSFARYCTQKEVKSQAAGNCVMTMFKHTQPYFVYKFLTKHSTPVVQHKIKLSTREQLQMITKQDFLTEMFPDMEDTLCRFRRSLL